MIWLEKPFACNAKYTYFEWNFDTEESFISKQERVVDIVIFYAAQILFLLPSQKRFVGLTTFKSFLKLWQKSLHGELLIFEETCHSCWPSVGEKWMHIEQELTTRSLLERKERMPLYDMYETSTCDA